MAANGIYPQYVGPTEQYRLASLYPRWVGGFLLQQVPEVQEAANEPGGILKPFKRVAVTPEVMAAIRADWEIHFPTVVIPSSEPGLRPIYSPDVQADAGDGRRFDGYYTEDDSGVAVLTRTVVVALPQFNLLTSVEVADPVAGVAVEAATAGLGRANGAIGTPAAGSLVEPVNAAALAYRMVEFPETVKNPTDEELAMLVSLIK